MAALGVALGRDEPSSLTLLSSEERGEGRLSVSELLLAPPGQMGDKGGKQ